MQNQEPDAKMAESDASASAWLSDRAAGWRLGALIAYAAVRSVVAAAARPFWYDEMCTWIMVHQPSVRAIWSALEHAADGQGPAFYVIERAASGLLRNQEIALRLPSIFSYCFVTLCIFIFVRRRAGSTYALICAGVPLATVLFWTYAIEARPYGLVTACVAGALVCYQRASSWRWALLMGLSLAFAETLNYYAVFALIPIGVAEAARWLRARELRMGVWLALLGGAAPLAIFWGLLSRFREYMGPHFWAQPSLVGLAEFYGVFFETGARWGVAVAAALAVGVVAAARRGGPGKGRLAATSASNFDNNFGERVLTLALLGLPIANYMVTKIAHGGFTVRYVLFVVLGVPLAIAWILPSLQRRTVALLVTFLVFGVGVREGWFWMWQIAHPADVKANAVSVERLVATAGHGDLPVVISDGIGFLPLAHYADPEWQGRFVCVVDPEQAVKYAGFDTVDKNLMAMRTIAPIRVYDFAAFAAEHSAYLLYSYSSGDTYDWWPTRLAHDGYSLEVAAADGMRKVYLVSPGKNSR